MNWLLFNPQIIPMKYKDKRHFMGQAQISRIFALDYKSLYKNK